MRRHPGARVVGIDSREDMLWIARRQLPLATFVVAGLEDQLPGGPFDVVVSAFAIHHLDGESKALLFRRASNVLSPGGRFAMLDVVIATEPVAAPIPLEKGVDKPSSVDDMLQWLEAAGLRAETVYSARDLAILAATAPESEAGAQVATDHDSYRTKTSCIRCRTGTLTIVHSSATDALGSLEQSWSSIVTTMMWPVLDVAAKWLLSRKTVT